MPVSNLCLYTLTLPHLNEMYLLKHFSERQVLTFVLPYNERIRLCLKLSSVLSQPLFYLKSRPLTLILLLSSHSSAAASMT